MNTLDIILLLLFIPGIIRGLSKGLMEQAVSLVGIALGAFLAYTLYEQVGTWLGGFWDTDETILYIVGFVVVLLLTFVVVTIAGKLLTKLIEMASLGWLNRILGLVLSLVVTALTLGLLALAFDALNNQFELVNGSVLSESLIYPLLKDFAQTVFPFIKQIIAPAAEALEGAVESITGML
ncbi:MAG: CvpA family protein [Bacteroidales bacterium]|nr:CvpA family protein [Bacteroidales bacterium]